MASGGVRLVGRQALGGRRRRQALNDAPCSPRRTREFNQGLVGREVRVALDAKAREATHPAKRCEIDAAEFGAACAKIAQTELCRTIDYVEWTALEPGSASDPD